MRMHILQATGPNLYSVVVHAPTPAGNNSAGVAWSTAIQNAGLAGTSMETGNGAGQISTNEANQVAAGTVIEAQFAWGDDPNWTTAQRLADLSLRATQAVDEVLAAYSAKLKWFGQTVA
jgi:hypothetical protein